MDICVLSDNEVGRLINHRIEPNHYQHRHVTSRQLINGIRKGQLEFLQQRVDQKDIVIVVHSKVHTLRVAPSGQVPVVQRVRSNRLKVIVPARELDLTRE